MVKKVECERCKKTIDRDHDLHVSLGTHDGKTTTDMRYFHFNCWRSHFEEKTREKAENIVNQMQERMMPIAKQLTSKIKDAMDKNGGQLVAIN